MTPSRRTRTRMVVRAAVVLLGLAAAGCTGEEPERREDQSPPVVQLGAPGESGTTLSPDEVEGLEDPIHTEADVAFVQEMIPHHAQALDMTALVPARAANPDLAKIAERIEVSQVDEIEQMEAWLEGRGQAAGGAHGEHEGEHGSGHGSGHADMPGMATPGQLARMADAQGPRFDRLFLQAMIRHHEGAIVMVETLLASGEGGQESEVFQLASHIASDQAVEIAVMKRELAQAE